MPTFDATDLDNAASESGVVHQNTTNTDHTNASELKQGYDYASFSEITPTPIGAWPLHEDSGTTTYDLAGTNNGTINGATVGQQGILGTTAYSFDGVDDYVDHGDPAGFDSPPLSVSFWMKTSVSDANWDSTHRPVTKVNDGGGFDGWFFMGDPEDNNGDVIIQLNGDNAGGVRAGSTTAVNDGVWHHVAMTYKASSSRLRIYVDGTMEDENASANPGDITTPAIFSLGSRNGSDVFYEGELAEVRVYDTELTSTEVQSLYDVVATSGTLTTQFKTV